MSESVVTAASEVECDDGGTVDDAALSMHRIGKNFAGVTALEDVSFEVLPGEVHALIGQNGAGKSTLMNILSGGLQLDHGEIRLGGVPVRITDPSTARSRGVAIVHQEFALCPNLTVAENVFLGKEPAVKGSGIVDFARMRMETRTILERLQVAIDPDAVMETLSVSEWQIIEICKALVDNPCFLIMDEPTAALSDERVKDLLDVVERLRNAGHGIIYVSHKLSEILSIADRVTILRDGAVVGTRRNEGLTEDDLVEAMLGKALGTLYPEKRDRHTETIALETEGLTRAGVFSDVSFRLHAGEVLGLTGLLGAGSHTLVRSLFGLEPLQAGRIKLDGGDVAISEPADAIRYGIGYVPSDRKAEGLVLQLSVMENTTMSILDRLVRWGLFDFAKRTAITWDLSRRLEIKISDPANPVATLSGGNQQKVSIAKWLARDCRILMFDEPTRGIDVRAKSQVWQSINALANQGVAILVVSSELPELLQGCDRLIVMRKGQVVSEYRHDEFDENLIAAKAASNG